MGCCREKLRHIGVEQGSRTASEHLQPLFRGEGASMRARGDGGVVAHGHGKDLAAMEMSPPLKSCG